MSVASGLSLPVKVGIVGTGYAAKRRAETFIEDKRSQLCYVTGYTRENVVDFCQSYNISSYDNWEDLVTDDSLDLVVICNVNQLHGKITKLALENNKNVIIEYPLSLDYTEALELLQLAQKKEKLLHIEHIEILGGMHRAIQKYLPHIGEVFYGRYTTIDSKNPAPIRWTFNEQLFGFPFKAALPRIHRFTHLFGEVKTVNCHHKYWRREEKDYYHGCLCDAQLLFKNGLIVDLVYGKGDIFIESDRTFEIHGEEGKIIFEGIEGKLITKEGTQPIELESRRGLFALDTKIVLDHLFNNKPLYINPESSLYALKIGEAAYQSAISGKTISVSE
ncbi:Gfo/Idh/MocA family protein [Crocosphaera chwakensis]|uniref:Homoserine dehydrogenase, NAD-binding protein n=1 Tax=Crocosphaera chwakensis CCY0110 TaxID=391612 RepID=A3IN28_9CHRO|nr:Gfo/Idh/MocA family oxidoreductase [Crocosphaera chwakensis]EAZ92005.1 Homoserine dehydrogenase, NAD-binding protein [Crocosphaera chwakensis CCY0110]